jgi:hypothetical protein
MTKKRDLPPNMWKPLYHARCIHITLSPMLLATNTLDKLKAHLVLRHLTLDGVVTFTRLASHLKRDILQPQPIPQSDPSIPPAVLPPPITNFLGASLGMSTDVIDDCWDILQDYVWEIPVLPLTSTDFQLFKQFGWPCGLS